MTYGPAAQADQGNPMFDNVFVNRTAYRAFVESGRWPDKTILILEIRRAAGKGSINYGGHYQSDALRVEAAVKDESRFLQKWAYFGFRQGDKAAPLPATSSCNSCHGQNAAVENTFVQFYPTLLEIATHKGTLKPAYVRHSSQHPERYRKPGIRQRRSALPDLHTEFEPAEFLREPVCGAIMRQPG